METEHHAWISVRQAAEQCRVSVDTMRSWARQGKVPSRDDTGRLLILAAALDEALRRQALVVLKEDTLKRCE